MDEFESEYEKKQLESEAEAWALIEEFFPNLAYAARELVGRVDGPTMFAQAALKQGKYNEIGGFSAQSKANNLKILCNALKADIDNLAKPD